MIARGRAAPGTRSNAPPNTYHADGKVTSIVAVGNARAFTFDFANRLVCVSRGKLFESVGRAIGFASGR